MKTILLPVTMQNKTITSDTIQTVRNFAGNVADKQHSTANSRQRAKWIFVILVLLLTLMQGRVWGQATPDRFWYKADGATPYSSNVWKDELNITNATNSGGTITLLPNSINFNPSLSFTNVDLQMRTGATSSVRSFIIVNNPTTTFHVAGLIGTSNSDDHGIRLANGGNSWLGDGNSNDWSQGVAGRSRINGSTGFAFTSWHIVNQDRGSTINSRYYIGGYYGSSRDYSGNIAEVMAFSGTVTNQNNLETYLAVKYGITLLHDYLNGSGSTVYTILTYGNNVAGLGNDATYGLKQSVSTSTTATGSSKIIMATTNDFTSENPGRTTSLAINQYLIWGHDNGSTSAWTTSGSYSVVGRTWKAQNTGSVGAVYFQIDLSGYPTPVSGSYTLLVDNDTNFGNGGTSVFTLTHSSGTLYTANVTFLNGTSYFTISDCNTPAAGVISGPSLVCNAPVTETYTVPAIVGATSYNWTYTGTNAIITNSGNSITISFAANATSGNLRVYGLNSCFNGTVSADFPIKVSSTVAVSVNQSNVNCYAGTDGSITITVSGGTGPYNYSVDNGASWTPALPVLPNPYQYGGLNVANGPYRIKVMDSNGCVSR